MRRAVRLWLRLSKLNRNTHFNFLFFFKVTVVCLFRFGLFRGRSLFFLDVVRCRGIQTSRRLVAFPLPPRGIGPVAVHYVLN